MSDDQTRKVAELIKGERFGFLTTITMDGRLTSRPMTLQEVEFDGDLWFFAERDSNPIKHITLSPQVNVGVGSGGSWVSLAGRATVHIAACRIRCIRRPLAKGRSDRDRDRIVVVLDATVAVGGCGEIQAVANAVQRIAEHGEDDSAHQDPGEPDIKP